MPKANADYGKLLRHASADFDHASAQMDAVKAQLVEALDKVPGKSRIMQLAESYGGCALAVVQLGEQVERYTRLVAAQNAKDGGATEPTD